MLCYTINYTLENLFRSPGFQQRISSIALELKIEYGCFNEGKRNSVTLPVWPILKAAQLSAKWDILRPRFFSIRGNIRMYEWALASPGVCNVVKEAHFSLAPARMLNHGLHDLEARRGYKSDREEFRKALKGAWILNPTNWLPTPANNLTPRILLQQEAFPWATSWCLTHGFFNWLLVALSFCIPHPHTPTSWPALCVCSRHQKERIPVSRHRISAQIWGPGRNHKLELCDTVGRAKGRH